MNRLVALKLIRHGRHASETERTRFLREAEAVARLQHPHIVVLYEGAKLEEAFQRPLTTREFYILWNAPAQIKSPHRSVAERADRFCNLVESPDPP